MGGSLANFRPDDPLTQTDLRALVGELGSGDSAPAPGPPGEEGPSPAVTMATLDARLVDALGLGASAARITAAARAAGLNPPSRFGTEVAARLLGLRTNHPARSDDLELLPSDPATRAEAAFSVAQILKLAPSDIDAVRAAAAGIGLPHPSEWQARVLNVAIGLIGYPYVWGGSSETAEEVFGVRSHGGFDCSGFVWRVYKIETYAGGEELTQTLRGRTTYVMSGEVPKTKRIAFAKLQPADVVFFGDHGPKSAPGEVGHMGIYLGGGWFIHSSDEGVALARLTGWYRERFAWARRPLAEAGLS
jgi:cell wall-associated NlpC family hydrolase